MKIVIECTPAELRSLLVGGASTVVGIPESVKPDAPVMGEPDQLGAPVEPIPASSDTEAKEAFDYFQSCVLEWVQGFEQPDQPQPDRIDIIRRMGSGRMMVPIMKLALERGSLQRLISDCLKDQRKSMPKDDWLDYVGRISAQMVAISHMGFPDLVGMFDYSTKWRRTYVD